ncbi:MAG: CDC27 family protein [Bacteroidota bacterium]
MHQFSHDNENVPLSKFELMLKTNSVYFFDAEEFEDIILHYIDNGKLSLAKKAIFLGLNQHPSSVALQLMKVEIFIVEEKYNEAEIILNKLHHIEPSNEEIYIQKASIYSKKGLHKKAIEVLQLAVEFSKDEIEIYSMIGMEYLFIDDFDTARLNFAKCLEVDFDDYSALYNVIYCFDMLKQHDEAIKYLDKHINRDPYSEVAWHQLGRQYFIVENYEQALVAFDYAILVDEEFIGAHLEKAKTLEKLKRYEEAIDFYNATMELDTPTSFAYLQIGRCYEKLDNTEFALDYYNKTVNEDPLLDKGWLALTDIYIKKSNYQKALYYIKKALSIDEENNEYWIKLAEINLKLNLFEEAAKAYRKTIELQDDRLDIYISFADVLYFLGDYNDALDILYLTDKKDQNNPEILYRFFALNYLINEKPEAFLNLEKALKIDFDHHLLVKDIYSTVFDMDEIKAIIKKFNEKS